jgi:hypothetical protein
MHSLNGKKKKIIEHFNNISVIPNLYLKNKGATILKKCIWFVTFKLYYYKKVILNCLLENIGALNCDTV